MRYIVIPVALALLLIAFGSAKAIEVVPSTEEVPIVFEDQTDANLIELYKSWKYKRPDSQTVSLEEARRNEDYYDADFSHRYNGMAENSFQRRVSKKIPSMCLAAPNFDGGIVAGCLFHFEPRAARDRNFKR